jgi:hypothetical protein
MQRHPALFARDANSDAFLESAVRDRLGDPLWRTGPNRRALAGLCVLTTLRCELAGRAQARDTGTRTGNTGTGNTTSASISPFDGAPGLALAETVKKLCGRDGRGDGTQRKAINNDPLHTLKSLGLIDLFPHMESLPRVGTKNVQHAPRGRKSPVWEYFDSVGKMQQLVSVADGLAKQGGGARSPKNAKYVAHQIALLYQGVASVRGELKQFKPVIERRFDEIKNETENGERGEYAGGTKHGGEETRVLSKKNNASKKKPNRPALTEASMAWTEAIAGEIAAMTRSFPPQASEKLRAVIKAASGVGSEKG